MREPANLRLRVVRVRPTATTRRPFFGPVPAATSLTGMGSLGGGTLLTHLSKYLARPVDMHACHSERLITSTFVCDVRMHAASNLVSTRGTCGHARDGGTMPVRVKSKPHSNPQPPRFWSFACCDEPHRRGITRGWYKRAPFIPPFVCAGQCIIQ